MPIASLYNSLGGLRPSPSFISLHRCLYLRPPLEYHGCRLFTHGEPPPDSARVTYHLGSLWTFLTVLYHSHSLPLSPSLTLSWPSSPPYSPWTDPFVIMINERAATQPEIFLYSPDPWPSSAGTTAALTRRHRWCCAGLPYLISALTMPQDGAGGDEMIGIDGRHRLVDLDATKMCV